MTREKELADAFVDLSAVLVSDYDVTDLLYRLVEHSVQLLDAAEVGLLLADQRGSLHVMASSDERARLVELFQLQADEGPCLDCYHSGELIAVADLQEAVERWPRFAPAALDRGYAAVHALPLRLRADVIGALNLFSTHPGALTDDNLHIGRALADVATVGILHERTVQRHEVVIEQLEGALNSRIVIEQAKGLLAAHGTLPMDEAFRQLRYYARNNGARLTQVARDLADGHLDPNLLLSHYPADQAGTEVTSPSPTQPG